MISFEVGRSISWSHAAFGSIIAVGVGNNVVIFKDNKGWNEVYRFSHSALGLLLYYYYYLVSSVKFYPHSSSLILASSSFDGSIGIHKLERIFITFLKKH